MLTTAPTLSGGNERKDLLPSLHLPIHPRDVPEGTLVLDLGMALSSVCCQVRVLGRGRQWRMYLGSRSLWRCPVGLGTGHVRVRMSGVLACSHEQGLGGLNHL